jgi:hypothetical protein
MFTLATYTAVHVIISLIGIVSGLIVAAGLLSSSSSIGDAAVSVDDCAHEHYRFGFPVDHLCPRTSSGAVAAGAGDRHFCALWAHGGAWRWTYAVTAMICALHFNVFCARRQLFQKVTGAGDAGERIWSERRLLSCNSWCSQCS